MIGPISNVPVDAPPARAVVQPLASSLATQSDETEKDLAATKFFSPVVRLDVDTHTAVLQYRDPWTGNVTTQYPSEKQLEAYKAQEHAEARAALLAASSENTAGKIVSGHDIDAGAAAIAKAADMKETKSKSKDASASGEEKHKPVSLSA